jgi:outer membrane protein OmpA-like peptidoglycan-associated protein
MNSQDDENTGIALGVVLGLIALVIALVIGITLYLRGAKMNAVKTPTVAAAALPATAAAPAAPTPAADAASVVVENGVVKFYFASGKADVASGGKEALADVVKAVAAGKTAVISGFHDATGDPTKNAELAKKRAFAVRDALQALGVAQDKVSLKKPEQLKASGSDAQARRVEVAIQ